MGPDRNTVSNIDSGASRSLDTRQSQPGKAPVLGQKVRSGEVSSPKQPTVQLLGASSESALSEATSSLSMRNELNEFRDILARQFDGLTWIDLDHGQNVSANILRVMARAGLAPSLAREIAQDIPADFDFETARRYTIAALGARLRVLDDPIFERADRVLLCGPTGVGKTIQASKIAARFALRHGSERVVLISADGEKLGAQYQLRAFGKRNGITVLTARSAHELDVCLKCLPENALVVIDTAGTPVDDIRLREMMTRIEEPSLLTQQYLVLSATTDYHSLSRTFDAASDLPLDGCILTKLDEAAVLGPTLSALIEADEPIAYLSSGQRVPDDLEIPSPLRLAERTMDLGDDTPLDAGVPHCHHRSAAI